VERNTTTSWTNPVPKQTPCQHPDCQQVLRDARRSAGYYHDLYQGTRRREQQLRQTIDDLRAEVRLLKQRLYGRSCEGHHDPNDLAHGTSAGAAARPAIPDGPPPRRRRGQQPGRPGHGRRRYDHLPTTHEMADLPPEQRHCRHCGQPFAAAGSESHVTTVVEVTVSAHRRLIRRRRYRPVCRCGAHPALITAPPPPRLIANSALGISVWVQVLLDKYASYRPTYRLLTEWRQHGLDLALGTVTDGLHRLLPLFEPVYQALRQHLRRQEHWHGDETRWQVFETVEGKVGYQWYLWLVLAREVAVFVMAAGRAHDVPEELLGPDAQGLLSVDRYAAYRVLDQVRQGQITLALCWAHQRRDFLDVERSRPELRAWVSAWLDRIADLYRLNAARRAVWQKDASAFAAADEHLKSAVAALARVAEQEQAQAALPLACRKVLQSLQAHWPGLTVFVDHPDVPMDNNTAERAERGPVLGRKNYYGSGAVWAGQLAAILFSVLQTLQQWGLNARQWLTGYLTACAEAGGQAAPDLRPWLPWTMTEAERATRQLETRAAPRPADDSS
jgi:transposase